MSHYLRSRQHQLLPNKILAEEEAPAPSLKGRSNSTNPVSKTLSTLKMTKLMLTLISNPSGVAAANVEGEEALICDLISLGTKKQPKI